MKLSKASIIAAATVFILANLFTSALILKEGQQTNAVQHPYKETIKNFFLNKDQISNEKLIKDIYPKIQRDHPQIVQNHQFYLDKLKKNQFSGKQIFSELTMRIFSFYQFAKRKNWQTLTRMSFQTLEQYTSSLERYLTGENFNIKKILNFNNEMRNVTINSSLSPVDKNTILANLQLINQGLGRAEIFTAEKESLQKIENELDSRLVDLASYYDQKSGFNIISSFNNISSQTKSLIITQYLVSGLILFLIIGYAFSSADSKYMTIFKESDLPMALLNKKGRFVEANSSLKELLNINSDNAVKKMNWSAFQKVAKTEGPESIKNLKDTVIIPSSFSPEKNFMLRLVPKKKLKGFLLSLTPSHEVESFKNLSDLPPFLPENMKEDIKISETLEDILADLSNLFQSKHVEVSLILKEEQYILHGNIEMTKKVLKSFIRDMVIALSPKSKSKKFDLVLDKSPEGIVLLAKMDDIQLNTPVLKSNFKLKNGKKKSRIRNLDQGIEELKSSKLGFNIDLGFRNNFDLENNFVGSDISINMANQV